MAKKKTKKKGQQQQQKISPEKFLREKGRQLPLDKCYMSSHWQDGGMALVMVTRRRPSGKIVMGFFEVDTYCFGVKDAMYRVDMDDYDITEMLCRFTDDMELKEVTYPEAHNMIYGSIEFAAEGGLKPAPEFRYAKYVLEEDTEDVPLIEYEFGREGKHLLIAGPRATEMNYYDMLVKNLGKENVKFIASAGALDKDYEEDKDEMVFDGEKITEAKLQEALEGLKKMQEESLRHPSEKYSYEHPAYPQTLTVKHSIIADELFSPSNYKRLSDDAIRQILDLPADEAARDLGNVILYVIGQTYKEIGNDTIGEIPHSALMHALMLQEQIRSDGALDAMLQLMRQTVDFAEYHLGDLMFEIIPAALYNSALEHSDKLEELLNTPGLSSYMRGIVAETLTMIAVKHPERRGEIIEIFRRRLQSMVPDLPEQYSCDGNFAGSMMSYLIDLEAKELIPEIKEVFATGCVDKNIAGDYDTVMEEINHPFNRRYNIEKYQGHDIYKQSEKNAGFIKAPDERE